jgi:hypothetical protein
MPGGDTIDHISVIVSDEPNSVGQKGFFTETGNRLSKADALSPEYFYRRLSGFVQVISSMLEKLQVNSGAIASDKIKMNAKGEVRLIASGSVETKGAIKLTFARR